MRDQHCIAATLATESAVETLTVLLDETGAANRTEFAREVCRHFGFRDARNRLQLASCLKALRSLHRAGRIHLPAPVSSARFSGGWPSRLGQPVPEPTGVPGKAGAVQGLRLTLTTTTRERQVWNELIAGEHPQGAALHAGAQLRYLIESDHGLLGAVGFAASALALAARDTWIGWEPEVRRRRLHRVVGLSRFLIRPCVRCHLLASMVLGKLLRRFPDDFRQRYGYSPALVETFVNPEEHTGTCFRAANFKCVGRTVGRGRFAPHDRRVPRKSIFVYPLRPDWRDVLGAKAPPPSQPLGPATGLSLDEFAANELGGARLGDVRWSKRLVQTAAMQAAAPTASIPSAAEGRRAAIKGHYRLIDQPADSAVTPENILAPHRARTLRRMQAEPVALCVQGGTDLSFADHPGCAGQSQRRNPGSEGARGLHLHATVVLNQDGIPLGVPQIQYDARDSMAPRGEPLEERKALRSMRGLRECADLSAELPGTRVVSVVDRVGDVFAIFAEQCRLKGVELVVRAQRYGSRGKGQPEPFERICQQSAQAELEIEVTGPSARRGTGNRSERPDREARTAKAELRWGSAKFRDRQKRQEPLRLQVVHLREGSPQESAKALEWFLVTSMPVETLADAERVLNWYRVGCRIEDWCRILKTGCRVEHLGHRKPERIERAVTIKAVIAWRLAALTLLGKDTPELPMELSFTRVQMRVLQHFANQPGLATPENPGADVPTMAIQESASTATTTRRRPTRTPGLAGSG